MACRKIFMLFLIILGLLGCSKGAYLYFIGGRTGGWNQQGIDYVAWASTVNFLVGDTIVFSYDPAQQNALQVKKEDYYSCSSAAPIAVYTSGTDSIKIQGPGEFYFISGFPGMCEAGQKVKITVFETLPSNPPPPPPPYHIAEPGPFMDPYSSGLPSASNDASSTLNIDHCSRLAFVAITVLLFAF